MHSGVRTAEASGRSSGRDLGRPAGEGESPVGEGTEGGGGIQSTPGHEKPWWKKRGPPRNPEYCLVTDRAEYCEGKVKRTPGGE